MEHRKPPTGNLFAVSDLQPQSSEELSLIDLWFILTRHKKFIMIVVGICLSVGLAASFVLDKKYEYSTTIEIGAAIQNGETNRIEDAGTLLAKIRESYIPLALHKFIRKHPDSNVLPRITADIPQKSQLILLKSKGAVANEKVYLGILNDVLSSVTNDHKSISEVIRKKYEVALERQRIDLDMLQDKRILAVEENALKNKIRDAENRLAGMIDELALLKNQYEHIKMTKKLVQAEIVEIKELLMSAEESRASAVVQTSDPARAITLLMLDSQIQQNRNRLAGLEERLFVTLVHKYEQIDSQVAKNKRDQTQQRLLIGELKSRLEKFYAETDLEKRRQLETIRETEAILANLRPTRAVVPPMRSVEKVGMSRSVVGLLSLALGLCIATFGTLILEFIEKYREQRDFREPY